MKTLFKNSFSLVIAIFLAFAYRGEAITVDFASVSGPPGGTGSTLKFTGTGSTFEFVNAEASGRNLEITSSNGTGDSVGLVGNIGGTFSIGAITTSGSLQTAPVSGTGTLSIFDGTTSLTANVNWQNIFTFGTVGGLGSGATLNLSGITYTGTNSDLLTLASSASHDGTVLVSFQFSQAKSLLQLTAAGAINQTSYSGSIFVQEPTGKIGDYIWLDDGNGIQDDNEQGIPNIPVYLKSGIDGTQIAQTVTDGQGKYLFSGLDEGNYTVVVGSALLPAGLIPTINVQGNPTKDSNGLNHEANVVLDAGKSDLTVDFGYVLYVPPAPLTASIGDFVWKDLNRNGVQDVGEPGIDGVTVTLTKPNSVPAFDPITVVTTGHGHYQFDGLLAGEYVVTVNLSSAPLAGLSPSPTAPLGTPPEDDSNPNGAHVILAIDTASGTLPSNLTIDFGFFCPLPPSGRIGNYVWKDSNENGFQDSNEYGINGVTVTLKNVDTGATASTITANGGKYYFTGLPAGKYIVAVNLSSLALRGYISTFPEATGVGAADDSNDQPATVCLQHDNSEDLTIDFGFIPTVGCIGDRVWKDTNGDGTQDSELAEPGIPGIKVRLFSGSSTTALATTTTNSSGLYKFDGLQAGTYRVELDDATLLGAGWERTTIDADDSTEANDSNPIPATVVLENNHDSDTTIDFGYVPPPCGRIGNFVWKDWNANGKQDSGEPGIGGVTVFLRDGGGNLITQTTTNANGGYLFSGLSAGSYLVEVNELDTDIAGLLPTYDNAAGTNPGNDSNANPAEVTLATNVSEDLTIDFGFIPPGCGCIGNYVWKDINCNGIQDCSEPGIKGVTVKLYWNNVLVGSEVTDSCGRYYFCGLWAGTYRVEIDNNQSVLSGLVPTQVASGSNRSYDSNANPAIVSLATNKSCDSTVDFGYKKGATSGPITTCPPSTWGCKPSGNNWGACLAKYFPTVYPKGFKVGGKYCLTFTSSKGIENFMPCRGSNNSLRSCYTNPTTSLGCLAVHCVALRLNVDFSNNGITASGLAKCKFKSGKFAGCTVSQVLCTAESVLGGGALPSRVSYSDLCDACELVNSNFENGGNRGYLSLN